MIKVVEYVSLFLWGIYFFLATYREVKSNNNIKLFFKKPFHFLRIDNLFFLVVFLLYKHIARIEVLPYLYLIIVLTNIVYLAYDLADNYKEKKIKQNEYVYFLVMGLVLISLFIYLIIFRKMIYTIIITLVINLFIPLMISLVKLFKKH